MGEGMVVVGGAYMFRALVLAKRRVRRRREWGVVGNCILGG